jgi:hypothetical protein
MRSIPSDTVLAAARDLLALGESAAPRVARGRA